MTLEPAPVCSFFCQRPLTCLLPSHHLRSAPHPQSQGQQNRSRGRHCARRHPQGDADHQPEVRRRPRVFAFVSMPTDKKANTLWQPIIHHSDISCPL